MTQNIFVQTIKSLFIDLIGEILYFPFWWYSRGLQRITIYIWQAIKRLSKNLGLKIMIKNIFKPMFGQHDKAGRFISFFMRLLLLFVKVFVFILFSIFYIVLFLFWLILPILVVFQLSANIKFLWPS